MASTAYARRRKSPEDKAAEVDQIKARFEDWSDDQDEASLAAFIALHDGYSEHNALLIAMQLPDATDVRAYGAWQEQGRQVRKGEHGARIWAPAGKRDEKKNDKGEVTEKGRSFFRLVSVFDISQTDPIEEASK